MSLWFLLISIGHFGLRANSPSLEIILSDLNAGSINKFVYLLYISDILYSDGKVSNFSIKGYNKSPKNNFISSIVKCVTIFSKIINVFYIT